MKKVFISSVMGDYSKFRLAAKKAVEMQNCHPVMAEDFGARPTSAQAACLEGVRNSDIYLGILGGRYSEPTRDEFKEAQESGRPVLVFVETVDRDTQQKDFVSEVEAYATGYHRAAFANEGDLREGIIRALSRLLTASEPDFDASDKRLQDVQNLVVGLDRGSESWLWLGLAPSPQQQIISVSAFGNCDIEDTVVEPAFKKALGLFERRFGTDVRRQRGWLEIFPQQNAKKPGSFPVLYLLLDRQATLAYGRIISKESDSLFPVIFQAPVECTFPRTSGPVDRRSRHHPNRTSEVANLRKGDETVRRSARTGTAGGPDFPIL